MAHYSIFADTIADMTWPEVEKAGQQNIPLLVPVAVIEQHGHHLPLATDTYGAHLQCVLTKKALAEAGVEALVAPPYYLGVNATTGMFAGSLNIKSDTVATVLTEVLQNYADWGFRRQFVISHHGDPQHNRAVWRSVKALREAGADTVWVLAGQALGWVDLERAKDEAVLLVPESETTRAAGVRLTKSALDIHAGERETSMIMRFFPDTLAVGVDPRSLQPVPETLQEFMEMETTGGWRRLSPMGHIGDPAVASVENGELYELEAADIAAAIGELLRRG